MVVEYILVKCFSTECGMYQVIQLNKASKFTCKVCQEKQSILQRYATSYKAKDLRELCQKYNLEKGLKHEEQANKKRKVDEEESIADNEKRSEDNDYLEGHQGQPQKKSRWSVYLDNEGDTKEPEEEEEPNYVLLPPEPKVKATNRKRKDDSPSSNRTKKSTKPSLKQSRKQDDNNESENFQQIQRNTTNDSRIFQRVTNNNSQLNNVVNNDPSLQKAKTVQTNPKNNVNSASRWNQYTSNNDKEDEDDEDDGFVLSGKDNYVVVDDHQNDSDDE